MKRLTMVAALALAQSGCVTSQEDSPLLFGNVLALEGCDPDTSKFISQGSLDVAGGGNYVMAVQARNIIPTSRVIIIGDTPTNVGGSSVTLTEIIYRYESSPELGLPEEDRVATYAVVPAGSGDNSYVPVSAFGPLALEKLRAVAPASPGVSVISHIKARGRVGSTSNVETNEFSFPVRVFASVCSSPATAGVCSPGQDVPTACPAPTTPAP
ncbi:hypothetical protein F0U62_40805 [Cystobacter fuscus]|uniref:hypothetical protein n=1 Tax=Cystobacter fuscus TaxID=43 RepID=UPI002B2B0DF0|nr:hypothetical protein F0U62_40805 [Cystobacter fuscus]